jgi:guanine deaminase
VTLYRASVVDTPRDPFSEAGASALRCDADGAVVVADGLIIARGSYHDVRATFPAEPVIDLTGAVIVPGFVDTHVHYPQMRVMGGLGQPLLTWLGQRALPEERRLADAAYAQVVSDEFLNGLLRSGTTSALVFGAHYLPAMESLFAGADQRGLNKTSGLVVSDRNLPDDLLTTPGRARDESRRLIERWHGRGRLRYAVTPRFSLSASEELLDVCQDLLADDVWFTSHINESMAEVAAVAQLFPNARDYLDTYERHGLVTARSVFAHNVQATDFEMARMGAAGAWTAHCPTSNAALGSGPFPMRRHVDHGVGVALGCDVGAGTGLYLPKEGLQAYFIQQLMGTAGYSLTATHLLYLATRAGALAMGIADRVGDFAIGKEFDAVLWRAPDGSDLSVNLSHATDPADALARIFALTTPVDVAAVWLRGELVQQPTPTG